VAAFGHVKLCFNIEPRAERPKDVDKLLMQGPRVCACTNAEQESADVPEYFDVAVRNEQLKNFLLRTPQRILAHKFCDRRFMLQFSIRCGGVRWFRPESWLYFYSRAECINLEDLAEAKGGASFSVQVTESDRQIAASFSSRQHGLADAGGGPKGKRHPVEQFSLKEVTVLTASLRECMEEQFITLESLDQGLVRSEQLQMMCSLAVQARAGMCGLDLLRGWRWDWACAIAGSVAREVCASMRVDIVE